jgi:dipeptidyl aminopeptidase/acylaminoacyl peptidase
MLKYNQRRAFPRSLLRGEFIYISSWNNENASYSQHDAMFKKNKPYFLIIFFAMFVLTSCANPSTNPSRSKTPSGERYVYKVVDKHELDLFIYLPPEEKRNDDMPAILFFHGGGYTSGSAYQFEHQSQYFASLGIVCI